VTPYAIILCPTLNQSIWHGFHNREQKSLDWHLETARQWQVTLWFDVNWLAWWHTLIQFHGLLCVLYSHMCAKRDVKLQPTNRPWLAIAEHIVTLVTWLFVACGSSQKLYHGCPLCCVNDAPKHYCKNWTHARLCLVYLVQKLVSA